MSARQVEERVLSLLDVWSRWSILSPVFLWGLEAIFRMTDSDWQSMNQPLSSSAADGGEGGGELEWERLQRRARISGVAEVVWVSQDSADPLAEPAAEPFPMTPLQLHRTLEYVNDFIKTKTMTEETAYTPQLHTPYSGTGTGSQGVDVYAYAQSDSDRPGPGPSFWQSSVARAPLLGAASYAGEDEDEDDIDGVPMGGDGGDDDDIDGVPLSGYNFAAATGASRINDSYATYDAADIDGTPMPYDDDIDGQPMAADVGSSSSSRSGAEREKRPRSRSRDREYTDGNGSRKRR
jgi:hypothetical protein